MLYNIVSNNLSMNKETIIRFLPFFHEYSTRVPISSLSSILTCPHPLSLDDSPVLSIFHGQFKWCTPVVRSWKCLLLILGGPHWLYFCTNYICHVTPFFHFALSSVSSLSIRHMLPLCLFGYHSGDVCACVRCLCVRAHTGDRALSREHESFSPHYEEHLWRWMFINKLQNYEQN